MTVLRWETPPVRARGNWQKTVAKLKDRPGDWALILDAELEKYAYRVTTVLRKHGCETRSLLAEGRVSVWARWCGE